MLSDRQLQKYKRVARRLNRNRARIRATARQLSYENYDAQRAYHHAWRAMYGKVDGSYTHNERLPVDTFMSVNNSQ